MYMWGRLSDLSLKIFGLSGLRAQKSGAAPKVRYIAVLDPRKSEIDRICYKLTQNDVFRPFCAKNACWHPCGSSNHTLLCKKEWQLNTDAENANSRVQYSGKYRVLFTGTTDTDYHPNFHVSRGKKERYQLEPLP